MWVYVGRAMGLICGSKQASFANEGDGRGCFDEYSADESEPKISAWLMLKFVRGREGGRDQREGESKRRRGRKTLNPKL